MSASEGALLALIVDDDAAIQVLAAWAALELKVATVGARETATAIVDLTGIPFERVTKALGKLRAARVLIDSGVTELADKLLQSHVQSRLRRTK
jgi:predicted negative regulator of RcsB-dependent stress response